MNDPASTGLPDLDALIERADAEQAVLDRMMTADRASWATDTARSAALAARQERARASLAAARAQRTRAQRTGDPQRIPAADARVREAEADFARISDEVIDELLQISRGGSARFDRTMLQIRRTSDARDAVIDALAPGPHRQVQ